MSFQYIPRLPSCLFVDCLVVNLLEHLTESQRHVLLLPFDEQPLHGRKNKRTDRPYDGIVESSSEYLKA